MRFSEEEKQLLEKYVTSTDEDIFAVRGMEGMVGAAYARYSRAKGGFREVLLKEFIKEGIIDPKHADKLIERILIAYGDDSVGELEGCHVSFENISMLATKEIEDRRIGGSPIEQSTRYVFYDQQNDKNEYRYLRDESLINASFGKQYLETMDFIFETYSSLVEPMKEYFKTLKNRSQAEYDVTGEGVKRKYDELTDEKDQKAFRLTYNFDLRSKACDVLRGLLPLSTLTNVGMFGNGRFYQTLISHLLTTDIPEAQKIGQKAFEAASQIIPQYVRRARRNEYVVENHKKMRALAETLFDRERPEVPESLPKITLVNDAESRDVSVIASMLFPYTKLSLETLRAEVRKLTGQQRKEVIEIYVGSRKTRRDRPGRALEDGYPYTFDMVTNWGVYKDLMRHRMNSQQRQLFSPKIGFDMPEELKKAGFEKQALECVKKADALFDSMSKISPILAQYSVLHGHFVRWSISMNDREAMHMLELRSTPQGHPEYRRAAQMMHQEILRRSKWRGEMMNFVDYGDYYWSRADSEARQRVKEKKLDEKEEENKQ